MSLLIDKISLKDKKTLITFRKQLIDILENIPLTLLNHSKKKNSVDLLKIIIEILVLMYQFWNSDNPEL